MTEPAARLLFTALKKRAISLPQATDKNGLGGVCPKPPLCGPREIAQLFPGGAKSTLNGSFLFCPAFARASQTGARREKCAVRGAIKPV